MLFLSDKAFYYLFGILFLLFAFFNKHAISVLGLVFIYIAYKNVHLSNTMYWLLGAWIIASIFYDFRFEIGIDANFLLA